MKTYALALVELLDDWDDGMVSGYTGVVNGNGQRVVSTFNEDNIFLLSGEFLKWLTSNWTKYSKSPEYPFPWALFKLKAKIRAEQEGKE